MKSMEPLLKDNQSHGFYPNETIHCFKKSEYLKVYQNLTKKLIKLK